MDSQNQVIEWFSPRRFTLLLAILFVATFPLVIAGVHCFAYLDFGQFAYPVALYHQEAAFRGEMPSWNPLSSCGIPFLAQWNTLSLYPPSLLYVLLPLPWSLGIFCLLHLFFGGVGMYVFASGWTNNRLAGAFAGAAFAFNGLTWYGVVWPHIIAGLAWMPWVVLAMQRAWTVGGRAVLVASLAAAMQLLSGGAEVVLLTWLVLLAFWVHALVTGRPYRWLTITRGAIALLLALGVAAIQILPFIELARHSQRGAGYANPEMGVMPLWGWLNYLVPVFRCLRNPQGLYVPPNHWTGSYYVGIGTIALALLALWKSRDRKLWILGGLTLFALLMALGGPGRFHPLVTKLVPLLGFIRFPVKFVILTIFTLPLLAAFGVDRLSRASESEWPSLWRGLRMVVILMVVAILLMLWSARSYPFIPGALKVTLYSAASRAVFLILVLSCAWALGLQTRRWLPRIAAPALLLLLWADVLTHNTNLTPTVTPAALQPDAIRQFFKWDQKLGPGRLRLMQSPEAYRRMLEVAFTSLELDTQGRRLAQFFNYNLLDHTPKVDGFYSLYPKEVFDLFERLYYGTNRAEPLRDFMGAAYISDPTNLVGWVRRPDPLPVVTLGQTPVYVESRRALDLVVADDFDPRKIVYLPEFAREQVHAGPAPGARAQVKTFTPHRIEVEVQATDPTMLVVAQSYYPEWRAYVRGNRVPLWRANYAFQALAVPAGTNTVLLVYQDRAFMVGAIISGLVLTGIAVGVWRMRKLLLFRLAPNETAG